MHAAIVQTFTFTLLLTLKKNYKMKFFFCYL